MATRGPRKQTANVVRLVTGIPTNRPANAGRTPTERQIGSTPPVKMTGRAAGNLAKLRSGRLTGSSRRSATPQKRSCGVLRACKPSSETGIPPT